MKNSNELTFDKIVSELSWLSLSLRISNLEDNKSKTAILIEDNLSSEKSFDKLEFKHAQEYLGVINHSDLGDKISINKARKIEGYCDLT